MNTPKAKVLTLLVVIFHVANISQNFDFYFSNIAQDLRVTHYETFTQVCVTLHENYSMLSPCLAKSTHHHDIQMSIINALNVLGDWHYLSSAFLEPSGLRGYERHLKLDLLVQFLRHGVCLIHHGQHVYQVFLQQQILCNAHTQSASGCRRFYMQATINPSPPTVLWVGDHPASWVDYISVQRWLQVRLKDWFSVMELKLLVSSFWIQRLSLR